MTVQRCDLLAICSLNQHTERASFIDCRRINVTDTERSAMGHALRAMSAPPQVDRQLDAGA